MPPPPPKKGAPAPPKSSAPPPPGRKKPTTYNNNNNKNKNKNKKKTNYNNNNAAGGDDSTYNQSVTAASMATQAAKMAFKSFGKKVTKDVKTFTKSEMEHAGVDKIEIKKPNIKKIFNKNDKNDANTNTNNNNNNMNSSKKNPPRSKSYNKQQTNNNTFKSKTKTKTKPKTKSSKTNSRKPPQPQNNRNKNKNKNGLANKVAMFENNDKRAGNDMPPKSGPKLKKKKSESNGFFNKSKRDKNLKPSMVKKRNNNNNTHGRNKSLSSTNNTNTNNTNNPADNLKTYDVNWKEQKKAMVSLFKKKEKNETEKEKKENKVVIKTKQKTKELVGTMKTVKAGLTAETADPNRAAPKKINFKNLMKSKSAESDNGNDSDQTNTSNEGDKTTTKRLAFWKSKSYGHESDDGGSTKKNSIGGPPPPPPGAYQKTKSYSPQNGAIKPTAGQQPQKFNLREVNKNISKRSDYNEIQFKAVDPMEYRRQQNAKRQAGRLAAAVPNKPTSAASIASTNNNNNNGNMKNKTKPSNKPRKPPPLPSGPVPRPKKKVPMPSGPKKAMRQEGILQIIPTPHQYGWVFCQKIGMMKVSYKENINQLKKQNIFAGYPVYFDYTDKKNAKNIQLRKKIDIPIVKSFMNKQCDKTLHSAKFFVMDTQIDFEGGLSKNAFELPKNCNAKEIATLSESILNAFVNTDGGIMYIGIDSGWNIKGVKSSDLKMKEIEKSVTEIVASFKPLEQDKVVKRLDFSMVSILDQEGNLQNKSILKISIPGAIKDKNNDRITFATKSGDKYRKNLNYVMKVIM